MGTLNVADDKVFQFIEDVTGEIMVLFTGTIIHRSGDEVDYCPWEKSEATTAIMKNKGFINYSDLQVYFSNRLAGFLKTASSAMNKV